MELTTSQISKVTVINNVSVLNDIVNNLNITFAKYSINTPQRIRHYLAQILCESEGFHLVKENLNYSEAGLLKIFSKHFTPTTAAKYAHNPEAIANIAYANRDGNGDVASGDGWKFSGKGYIQITFKDNYEIIGKIMGIDLINNPGPGYLETVAGAALSAGAFWHEKNLSAIADISGDDVTKVTKIINGGINGLQIRQHYYNELKSIII